MTGGFLLAEDIRNLGRKIVVGRSDNETAATVRSGSSFRSRAANRSARR